MIKKKHYSKNPIIKTIFCIFYLIGTLGKKEKRSQPMLAIATTTHWFCVVESV